jgi:hypothetical protein
MDAALAGALPQLHHGTRSQVNATGNTRRLRIRNAALGLATLALAFYFGFIALLVFRSHH